MIVYGKVNYRYTFVLNMCSIYVDMLMVNGELVLKILKIFSLESKSYENYPTGRAWLKIHFIARQKLLTDYHNINWTF